jgi:transcriptional regulator with XRE-family HTH domain
MSEKMTQNVDIPFSYTYNEVEMEETVMNERLKEARKYLKLSQEFVARQMNLSRPTISAIESGQRKVTAEELGKFSELYGVSTEELMYGKVSDSTETEMFARAFSELPDIDKKEIMNLIDFKRRYKESMNG